MSDTTTTSLIELIAEAVRDGKTVHITADEITMDADSATWSNPDITIE